MARVLSKALIDKDPKGPWRTYLQRKGPQDDAAARGDRRRVSALVRATSRWRICCRRRGANIRASAWRRSTGPSSCSRRPASRRRATSVPVRRCTRWPKGGRTTTI
jgi:hypothetical protein